MTDDTTPADSKPKTSNPGMPWKTLSIAFAAWGLANMDQSLFGYAIPDLMAEFKIDLSVIGLMVSASFAAGIVITIIMGALTDRWGAKRTLPFTLGVSALLVGLQGIVTSALVFGVLRVVGAGLSAALSPITNAMVAAKAPPHLRALSIAILQCAYPFGWFVASTFVAPLIAHSGWRAPFLIAFAVVPVALLFTFIMPSKTKDVEVVQAKRPSSIAALFTKPYRSRTLLFGLTFLLYGGAVGGTTFYMPTFFHEVRGYSSADAARIVGLSYGIGIIGYIGAALVSEYVFGRRKTSLIWTWLGAIAFLGTIWLPRSVNQDIAAFGATTVFFYGASAILLIYLLESFPEHLRTTAAAVSGTACISAGFMTFPVLTTLVVKSVGWQLGFSAVIVPALVVVGVLMMVLPETAKQSDADEA
jgi:MFS family permease